MAITEIVITGGPCAGKTTGLSCISRKLQEKGFRVFIVPEVPTLFLAPGIPDIGHLAQNETRKYLLIQEQFILTHQVLRKKFRDMASVFSNENVVILFDRGVMDPKAYMPEELFKAILAENNLNTINVRDSYDAVIHLVTAANGVEEFYTTENNEARHETPEEARQLDVQTMNCWIGHPHMRVINNEGGGNFEEKMRRTMQAVCRVLGIPVPIEIEKKFLVKNVGKIEGISEAVLIEQIYLKSPKGEEVRIRKRGQGEAATYYQTTKKAISPGKRYEVENFISPSEYVHLKENQNPETQIIRKTRTCFIYRDQYFELDRFISFPGLIILEIELTEENDSVDIPPFIEIEREVTDDRQYSNYELSRKRD